MKNACVILPTYNEADNIAEIIAAVFRVGEKLQNWQISILVVDDNSPDGTGTIVKDLQSSFPRLCLLEGQKEGLGRAYIRGFQWVFDHLPQTDYVFEMDSDFSHDPECIADFLKMADSGYDFIIGSRYIKGGACPDWKWHRKQLSFWGNQYIRLVGGLSKVHDCTSGYRCISTNLLRKVIFSKLQTKGYAFQMSLLHQALKLGARTAEIPIIFIDRREGHSKLGKGDIAECLKTATVLRFRKY
ncbi:MAG: dolichyl-phosphate beta-D-mannosyltransferase [Candidatus Riflebacteria bacterium HGW-Riflebacteria-1]|jgi:dolichol-phosphate mannosyltransferase|nr:MAG: dolichyl-phosphate beta-D-mannosyltransferase [Candidatus Riflebacteria bacterium HGW-Riflebacteria-1]